MAVWFRMTNLYTEVSDKVIHQLPTSPTFEVPFYSTTLFLLDEFLLSVARAQGQHLLFSHPSDTQAYPIPSDIDQSDPFSASRVE